MDSLCTQDDAFIRMMFIGNQKRRKLTKAEESDLVLRYQTERDPEAAKSLVLAFLPWIVSQTQMTMRRFKRTTLALEDAVNAGVEGFLIGVGKWSDEHDARLSSFVAAYISSAVSHCDRHVMGMHVNQERVWRRIAWREAWLMDGPSENEPGHKEAWDKIATHLGVETEKVGQVARFFNLQSEEEGLLEEAVPASPRTSLCRQTLPLLERVLRKVGQGMTERQRAVWPDVLERLVSGKRLTSLEIGTKHGVTKERARQFEAALVVKLRKALAEEGSTAFHQFVDTPPDSHTLPIGFAV
jgi:DNA-directed RNA polymerase sigma subunit (sigma70/sigma32)